MYGVYDDAGSLIAKFVTPLTVKSNSPVFVNDSVSLKRSRRQLAAQRWEIEANLMPLNTTCNELFSFMIDKGVTGIVKVGMPQPYGNKTVANRAQGVCSLASTAARYSDTIQVSVSGFIPRGTFIKIGNDSKIYATLSDRNGNGNIRVYPKLRAVYDSGATVYHDLVLGDFLFDLDVVVGMVFTDGVTMDLGKIKLVEDI